MDWLPYELAFFEVKYVKQKKDRYMLKVYREFVLAYSINEPTQWG